jgi:hypothetical protein
MKHQWFELCVDSGMFEGCKTLKDFIARLLNQSNDQLVMINDPYHDRPDWEEYEYLNQDKHGQNFVSKKIKSPRYYGAGIEALAEVFIRMFANDYNIDSYYSIDSADTSIRDMGWDGKSTTAKDCVSSNLKTKPSTKSSARSSTKERVHPAGSPVYVQVKGPINPTKLHLSNDGSRITNFMGAAQSDALDKEEAYYARYILVTTCDGIHYILDDTYSKKIEVINFKAISKRIDNNPKFWREFMRQLEVTVSAPKPGPDAQALQAQQFLEQRRKMLEE